MAAPTKFTINAILCDSAATAEGKLYVHGGGWNGITAPTFPCTHPRVGLAAVLEVPYTFTNSNHQLEISIEDEDGKLLQLGMKGDAEAVSKISAVFNVGRPPLVQAGDAQPIPFAVNVDQLRFEAPGAYSVVFEVDGEEISRLRFRVQATPAQMMGFGR
ncbi:DUF6941 family protein [Streptosporangium sandarakinum]